MKYFLLLYLFNGKIVMCDFQFSNYKNYDITLVFDTGENLGTITWKLKIFWDEIASLEPNIRSNNKLFASTNKSFNANIKYSWGKQ